MDGTRSGRGRLRRVARSAVVAGVGLGSLVIAAPTPAAIAAVEEGILEVFDTPADWTGVIEIEQAITTIDGDLVAIGTWSSGTPGDVPPASQGLEPACADTCLTSVWVVRRDPLGAVNWAASIASDLVDHRPVAVAEAPDGSIVVGGVVDDPDIGATYPSVHVFTAGGVLDRTFEVPPSQWLSSPDDLDLQAMAVDPTDGTIYIAGDVLVDSTPPVYRQGSGSAYVVALASSTPGALDFKWGDDIRFGAPDPAITTVESLTVDPTPVDPIVGGPGSVVVSGCTTDQFPAEAGFPGTTKTGADTGCETFLTALTTDLGEVVYQEQFAAVPSTEELLQSRVTDDPDGGVIVAATSAAVTVDAVDAADLVVRRVSPSGTLAPAVTHVLTGGVGTGIAELGGVRVLPGGSVAVSVVVDNSTIGGAITAVPGVAAVISLSHDLTVIGDVLWRRICTNAPLNTGLPGRAVGQSAPDANGVSQLILAYLCSSDGGVAQFVGRLRATTPTAPTITSFSPMVSYPPTVQTPTQKTINGPNMSGVTDVEIGGRAATIVSITPTSIVVELATDVRIGSAPIRLTRFGVPGDSTANFTVADPASQHIVSGVVQTEDVPPVTVEGATVDFVVPSGLTEVPTGSSAISDVDGRYAIAVPMSTSGRLRVRADGTATPAQSTGLDARLALSSGTAGDTTVQDVLVPIPRVVTFEVKDDLLAPIAGAKVYAATGSKPCSMQDVLWDCNFTLPISTGPGLTGTDGRYSIIYPDSLFADEIFTVEHPTGSFTPVEVTVPEIVPRDTVFPVRFAPLPYSVDVGVTTAGASLVSGASVVYDPAIGDPLPTKATGANGFIDSPFTVPVASAIGGSITVSGDATTSPALPVGFTATATFSGVPPAAKYDFVVPDTHLLTVEVVDENDVAVSGATVSSGGAKLTCTAAGSDGNCSFGPLSGTTDANGKVTFRVPDNVGYGTPNTYSLTASKSGRNPKTVTVLPLEADTTATIKFAATPPPPPPPPPPPALPPVVTVRAPVVDAVYAVGEIARADFTCEPDVGGAPIATCEGTVADGEPLDTKTAGQFVFTVTATDSGGLTTVVDVPYTVGSDSTPPTVSILTPRDGGAYPRGGRVVAAYNCADEEGGSGVVFCRGSVANGELVPMRGLGTKTFTVDAEDADGNVTQVISTYTVSLARPDLRVRVGNTGRWIGDDQYSPTSQVVTKGRRAGRSVTYRVSVQNDAGWTDRMTVSAVIPVLPGFSVTCVDAAGADVTAALGRGWRTPRLAPGESAVVRCIVTVPSLTTSAASLDLAFTATSVTHDNRSDAVLVTTRRV